MLNTNIGKLIHIKRIILIILILKKTKGGWRGLRNLSLLGWELGKIHNPPLNLWMNWLRCMGSQYLTIFARDILMAIMMMFRVMDAGRCGFGSSKKQPAVKLRAKARS